MHRETVLTPADLIWPLFVTDGSGVEEPVTSLPGVSRWSVDHIAKRRLKPRHAGHAQWPDDTDPVVCARTSVLKVGYHRGHRVGSAPVDGDQKAASGGGKRPGVVAMASLIFSNA